jgi:hypothetical protein
MALEARLWGWLRDGLRPVRLLHLQRIESRPTGSGIPDLEGCWEGQTFWTELKSCARPASPTTQLDLRHFTDDQIEWLWKRWKCGGAAWLYLRVGERHAVSRYLVPGCVVRHARGQPEGWFAKHSPLDPGHEPLDWLKRVVRRDYFLVAQR